MTGKMRKKNVMNAGRRPLNLSNKCYVVRRFDQSRKIFPWRRFFCIRMNGWNDVRVSGAICRWFVYVSAAWLILAGTRHGWWHFRRGTHPKLRHTRASWSIWPIQCFRWGQPQTMANKCCFCCTPQTSLHGQDIRKFSDRHHMWPRPMHFDLWSMAILNEIISVSMDRKINYRKY